MRTSKITAYFVIFCIFFVTAISVNAESKLNEQDFQKVNEAEQIEISFKVGNDIIRINGEEVQVEMPYVVNGTTLVPLRVITEAFGTQVDWNPTDQSITLTYGGVVIKLTINDKKALVDDKEVEILEAPVIKNDKTMVPLRFITENFGADVKYDEQTEEITVIKDIAKSNSIKDFALILKKTTKERIGDSFNNWSIALPKKMKMAYRNFNGTFNAFEADDGSYALLITIYNNDNETTDTVIQSQLDFAKQYTILDQGKKTMGGQECAVIAYKNQEGIFENRMFVKKDKIYGLFLGADNETYKKSNKEISNMLDSFQLGFKNDGNIEDLSDVDENGYRMYDSKEYGWTANIVADWIEIKNNDKENEIMFIEPQKESEQFIGIVSYKMFSIEDGVSLDEWVADEIRRGNEEHNMERIEVDDIKNITVNGVPAKELVVVVNNNGKKIYNYNVYMYGKEYKYHLGYAMDEDGYKDANRKNAVINMIHSFKFADPDIEEIGKLIDPDMIKTDEALRKLSSKEFKWSCELPVKWTQDQDNNDSDEVFYSDKEREKGISFVVLDNTNKASLESFAQYIEQEYKKDQKAAGTFKLGKREVLSDKNIRVYKYTNEAKYNGVEFKEILYIAVKSDRIYVITLYCNDLYYGEKTKKLFDDIWKSFKFE